MANLLDFNAGGARGNLAKPSTLLPIILGGAVLLVGFSLSERIVKGASRRVPFVSMPTSPFLPNVSAAPASTKQYIG